MARAKMAVGEIGTIATKQVAGNDPGKPGEAVKWQATARYGLMSGETVRIRRTASTKGKAEKAVRDEVAKRRLSGGAVTHASRSQTVAVIMDAWLASIKALPPTVAAGGEAEFTHKTAVAPQTFEQYARHGKLAKEALGGIEAGLLTTGQCEVFLHGLVDEAAGTGFTTARLTRVALTQAMTYAVRMGLRRENPVALVSALPKKVLVPTAPRWSRDRRHASANHQLHGQPRTWRPQTQPSGLGRFRVAPGHRSAHR